MGTLYCLMPTLAPHKVKDFVGPRVLNQVSMALPIRAVKKLTLPKCEFLGSGGYRSNPLGRGHETEPESRVSEVDPENWRNL